jgi:hypothetical protein
MLRNADHVYKSIKTHDVIDETTGHIIDYLTGAYYHEDIEVSMINLPSLHTGDRDYISGCLGFTLAAMPYIGFDSSYVEIIEQ